VYEMRLTQSRECDMQKKDLRCSNPEIRCSNCNRLLMTGTILRIAIKCPKCGYTQIIPGHSQIRISAERPIKERSKNED
jgi:phage FluMu protein Com